MTIIFQANHEQALQDAAKKSNKERGEVEDQIADMKVMRFGQTQFHRYGSTVYIWQISKEGFEYTKRNTFSQTQKHVQMLMLDT